MHRVNHSWPLSRMLKNGMMQTIEQGGRSTSSKTASATQKRQKRARRLNRE